MSYPSYPEYKESGIEWVGSIPSHWRVDRISSKYSISNGHPFSAEEFTPNGHPHDRVVRIRDILGNADPVYSLERCPKNARIRDGAILIGMDGDFNVVKWSGGDAKLNQRVCAVFSDEEVWDNFFLYYIRFPLKIINDLTFSTTVKHLAPWQVLKTKMPVPPKQETEKILFFLDQQTARIDALIAEQQRLIELLKEKRQAVISHAVTKGLDSDVTMKDSGVEWLGEVPEHWSTGRVGWWFDVELGKMLDESRITGESLAPYIRNTDVQWNGINTEDLPVMDFDEADRIRYGLRKGDLLVCEGGEIGRAAIWQDDDFTCFYQKALHRVRARKEGNVHFLKHVLRYYADNGILDGSSTSATINHFTREQFRALSIPFPPAGEQAEIADYIDSKSNDFDALEEQANAGIELLKERRSALISAAVTGKIDVRDWQPPSSETFPEASVSEGATA